MSDTEWTEEMRKEREDMRAGALLALRGGIEYANTESIVDRILPPPPPLHTYGREVPDGERRADVRRSDGEWGFWVEGRWYPNRLLTDDYIRQRAAEVPLTDAECAYLGNVGRGWWTDENEAMRNAFARVLRGEVRGE